MSETLGTESNYVDEKSVFPREIESVIIRINHLPFVIVGWAKCILCDTGASCRKPFPTTAKERRKLSENDREKKTHHTCGFAPANAHIVKRESGKAAEILLLS